MMTEVQKENHAAELRKRKLKKALFIFSFAVIPTLSFLVFYVYVNFNSFLMAFQRTENGQTVWTFATIQSAWNRLFPLDGEFSMIFRNTLTTFAISCCIFFVSFFVSYFLYKKVPFYKGFRILFYLPSVLPGVVIATVYRRWCATDGPFAELLCMMFDLKVVEPLADSRFANFFVWLNMVWLGFPGNLLLWSGSFARIPDSVIEAAKLDGVSAWREAFQIVIPCIWPTFMLLLTMQLSSIFSASGQVFLLTKGLFDTQTLTSWMYIQVYDMTQTPTANVFNMMSALGMMITAVAAAIVFTVRKFASKAFKEVQY